MVEIPETGLYDNSTTNVIELKNISVTQVVFLLKAGLSQVGTTCVTLKTVSLEGDGFQPLHSRYTYV